MSENPVCRGAVPGQVAAAAAAGQETFAADCAYTIYHVRGRRDGFGVGRAAVAGIGDDAGFRACAGHSGHFRIAVIVGIADYPMRIIGAKDPAKTTLPIVLIFSLSTFREAIARSGWEWKEGAVSLG